MVRIWRDRGFYYSAWDSPRNLEKKIAFQPDLFLVAESGGVVVGGVIGTYDGWGAYINHLAARAGPREREIEKKLLHVLERNLKKLGVTTAFVSTLPGHSENRLYEQSGFRKWNISQGWEKRL